MKKTLSIFLCMVLLACMMLTLTGPVLAADGSTTVYVTNTGECYHSAGCQYLKKSCIAISLEDAVNQGYRACSKCNPPALTVDTYSAPANSQSNCGLAGYGDGSTNSSTQSTGYGSENASYIRVRNELISEKDSLLQEIDYMKGTQETLIILLSVEAVAIIILLYKLHRAHKEGKSN